MFDLFLLSLPHDGRPAAAWAAFAGLVVGGFLWLFGSKVSRTFLALLGVAVGAWVGLRLPLWLNVNIGGWASACAGALVLGVFGYALDRLWVGLGLGILLAAWGAFGMLINQHLAYAFPSMYPHQSAADYLGAAYRHVPDDLRRILPVVAGLSIGATLALTLWLPRVSLYLFYALLGVTCLAVFGVAVGTLSRPTLLRAFPYRQTTQLLLALGLTCFGTIVQWRTSGKARPAKSSSSSAGSVKPKSKS